MNVLKRYIREVLTGTNRGGRRFEGEPIDRYGVGIRPNSGSHLEGDEGAEDKKAACTLIRAEDGKILAVSRRDDPTMWGLPGGKVDPGETSVQAAARELKEETGLHALKLTPVFSKADNQGFVTTTFACKAAGTINTNESGVIRWVEPDVLVNPASSPFVDYNKALFRELGIRYTSE